MKKIKVDICVGTTCFVMGGSDLQEIEPLLTRKYKDKVEVRAKTCLNLCNNNKYTKSPYVKVGEEVVSEATAEKVINEIERQANG